MDWVDGGRVGLMVVDWVDGEEGWVGGGEVGVGDDGVGLVAEILWESIGQ